MMGMHSILICSDQLEQLPEEPAPHITRVIEGPRQPYSRCCPGSVAPPVPADPGARVPCLGQKKTVILMLRPLIAQASQR